MTRFLHRLSTFAFLLGAFLALPGLLLLVAASGLATAAVDREQAAHDLLIDRETL